MASITGDKIHVVILGAGVIGLTVAHLLSSDAERYKVTILARDMPEDLDSQAFASPWAGANWSPMQYDKRLHQWEKQTFTKFWEMIPTGLVMKLPSKVYFEEHTTGAQLWWKDIVRDFHVLAEDEVLPPDIQSGVSFETISVNPGVYLPWLKSGLEQRGVGFVRHRLGSLDEVRSVVGDSAAVINATGLGARSLVGVQDDRMFPIRGQTIVAIAPKATEFVTVISTTKTSNPIYLIPRPTPPGMVLVGGTFQENNWDTSIHKDTAQAIWQRASAFVPELADPGTRIVSHNVGLRPARAGGPRVEAEYVDMPIKDDLAPRLAETENVIGIKKQLVVHSYGFGPAGYQQSWGAAAEVVAILRKELDAGR